MTTLTHISPKLLEIIADRLPEQHPEHDPSTNSNYQYFKVNQTDLDLSVSFEEQIVRGTVTFDLTPKLDTDTIVLDTLYLNVDQVAVNDEKVEFDLKELVKPLGAPLVIKASCTKDTPLKLSVSYSTTSESIAIQFMTKDQTTGKTQPYLFSQCEPHYFRSMCPSFDTPSIKSTFNFKVESPLPSLMSGALVSPNEFTSKPLHKSFENADNKSYYFKQNVPIPSYLVAIVSGDIVGAPTGPRSTVYSEPCEIAACKYEFEADMENFIVTAEKLIFDYKFGTFDSVVLPVSFPYLGMENTNLCTLSRTLLSGDRQNVDVVAHELAHSWSGNLVTNCSWEHFWLNEGWTVYIERRITGALYGEPTRHFSAIIGWTDLSNSIKSMGDNLERYSCLVQTLKDRSDPDDAFSTVPYEKGFNLLFHLENVVGRDSFDKFIPFYFNKFSKISLDTYQFLDCLYEFFADKKDLLDSVDWKTWLFTPGLPPKPDFDTSMVDACYELGDRWILLAKTSTDFDLKFSSLDISSFTANQNLVFIDYLSSYEGTDGFTWTSALGQAAIKLMDNLYPTYSTSSNGEVIFRWLRLQLTGDIKEARQVMSDWLGTVGRMKFVRPSYKLLNQVDRELALETYQKYKNIYNPICLQLVRKDISVDI